MSEDEFTEVTEQGWFSRIGDSIKGIIFGMILVVISFPLLFWNEGRAVRTAKSLEEMGSAVQTIQATTLDSSKEGKLVHIMAKAETANELQDDLFAVSAKALKLKRTISMYQWEEQSESKEEKKLGGGTKTTTTYNYRKVWQNSLIDSSDFKKKEGHVNPSSMKFEDASQLAEPITVGAYTLNESLKGYLSGYKPLVLTQKDFDKIPESAKKGARLSGGGLYFGDEATLKIGDSKVKFSIIPPQEVSLIAKQLGNTFEPYISSTGNTIDLLVMGKKSSKGMIQAEQSGNTTMTWIIRFVGFLLLYGGLMAFLTPLSVVADVIPFIGNIVEVASGILCFVVAAGLSLITIAIAWIFYRPVLGISLLVIGFVAIFMIIKSAKAKKEIA